MKTLTEEQLRELLREAWVHGWVHRHANGAHEPINDDRDGKVEELINKT